MLWIVFALVCLGLILANRISLIRAFEFESKLQLMFFVLPYFLFGSIHLLLMYESWISKSKDRSAFFWFRIGFWGLLTLTFFIVLFMFLYFFIMRGMGI